MGRRAVFPTLSAMKLNTTSFNGDIMFVKDEHDMFHYDSTATVFDENIVYEATGLGIGGFIRQIFRPNKVSITSVDSPYQAKINEFIFADSTTAEVRVKTPLSAVAGDKLTVKKTNPVSANWVIIDADINGDLVESRITHKLVTEASLFAEAEVWTLVYDGTNWVIESIALESAYTELWEATAIVTVPSGGQVISWTHVPLFTGQVPLLVSHLSGVLTSNLSASIDIELNVLWGYQINANNQDAKGVVSDTIVGGSMLFIDIISSFTSPRTGTFPFSQNTSGVWVTDTSDTLKFDASSDAAQSGTTDLTEALLFLSVG